MRPHPATLLLVTALLAACEDAVRPIAVEHSPLLPRLTAPQLNVAVSGPADLGPFIPSAINNLGQVAGVPLFGFGADPVIWTPSSPGAMTGTVVELPRLANAVSARTGGINDLGQAVGVNVGNPTSESHIVVWTVGPTGASITDLGTFGNSSAIGLDVNNAGQVVGWYVVGDQVHAFLWTPSAPGSATGTLVDLGTLGGNVSEAFDINNLGQVVGRARTPSGDDHAFLWTPSAPGASTGTMLDLGTISGGGDSRALSINDFGQVVGWSHTSSGGPHAALWTVSSSGSVTVQDLHPTTTALLSHAIAVNNLGQVVGGFSIGPLSKLEVHGFFWAPNEGTTVLNPVGSGCAPGSGGRVICSYTVGINDRGEVVGVSWTGSATHATRWTVRVGPPTPVEQVEAVDTKVHDLVTTGALSQGQGNALSSKLDAATKQLNNGNTQAAINLLEAFIRQCQAYVTAGILTAAEAQPLIDAAQDLIDELRAA